MIILELSRKGHGIRAIARALAISRNTVKAVLMSGTDEVPQIDRAEKADPLRDRILDLYARCEGNRIRVHEELLAQGATLGYSTLTAWLKRQGIGETPKPPAGQYHFSPGEEMQHDTSPFQAPIGGVPKVVQIASEVLCYSRMLFFQGYPRFRRFECKVFLSEAAQYFEGVCARCMIDNTHVVVLRGTGKDMVPVPEMAAFGERLGGFVFAAHEIGDANRSARVEGHFHFIQNNFFKGRTFRDWDDLNAQARAWCDKVNATFSNKLRASRRELFAVERPHLKRLPIWVPEVYQLHQRVVDLEGYIHLDTNMYSAPWRLVGKALEVRETKDQVELFDGPRRVAAHGRVPEPSYKRVTLPEHRPPRGEGADARKILPEEAELQRVFPEAVRFLALLKKKASTRYTRDVRRLLRFVHDYPKEPLEKAVATALQYGLVDLDRVERLVLRAIASDFFLVPRPDDDPEDPDDR
jgi:transposase